MEGKKRGDDADMWHHVGKIRTRRWHIRAKPLWNGLFVVF